MKLEFKMIIIIIIMMKIKGFDFIHQLVRQNANIKS